MSENNSIAAAYPIMAAVFISFMVTGMALPVLPLQVHDVLNFGPFIVGVVAGCQFVAALISRIWAGQLTDTRGSKFAVSLGLYATIIGGAFYTISSLLINTPLISVLFLLVGRTLLGGAESLIITGGMLWALQLIDRNKSAKVISWVGMAMFAALAVGAPIGSFVFSSWGFQGISISTIVMSCITLLIIYHVRSFKPLVRSQAVKLYDVLKGVALPGTAFALSGITFGSITTFLTLYFSVQNWNHGSIAFAFFAVMLIATRIFFGHLPDKFGGARVTFYCLFIQATGLILIGTLHSSFGAMLGAAIAGVGFSLVFPGLGIEAIKRVPAENKGLAMGIYNAFLDITLGFGSPVLGFLAGKYNVGVVFLLSALASVVAIPISVMLLKNNMCSEKIVEIDT